MWLPILGTDRLAPGTFILRRLSDGRVSQYWDPEHLVAKQLARDARSPQPVQDCCVQADILWDLAAVYPPGNKWEERMPVADVFNGPVVDISAAIAAVQARR